MNGQRLKVLEAHSQPADVEAKEVTPETVLAGLLREARGNLTNSSGAARVAAWRLIGEHLGMWREGETDRAQSGFELLVDSMAALRAQRARERSGGDS